VQGVFFRQETSELALELGVSGWVRNTQDVKVEAVFEGERENVEQLVEFCKRGSRYARVTEVEVTWQDYVGEFDSFQVRY
jgi:acylphosphatase